MHQNPISSRSRKVSEVFNETNFLIFISAILCNDVSSDKKKFSGKIHLTFTHVCCNISGKDRNFLCAMNEDIDAWIDDIMSTTHAFIFGHAKYIIYRVVTKDFFLYL